MIIKSMSRKQASFGQLMNYIDRDGGEELYRIRYNLAGRDRARIRGEFEANASRMRARKNGVFMYHEIISITRSEGLSIEEQKERLHHIAQQYVNARAPKNLCYGGLHADKKHSLHYHLMISANRAGEEKRHRLSKEQFRDIQVSLEQHVLKTMPELGQVVAIDKRAEARLSSKETELKRRGGKATERDEVAGRVQSACQQAKDRESLLKALSQEQLSLYVRGSLLGVTDQRSGKRHRLRTLSLKLVELVESRLQTVKEEERQTAPPQKSTKPNRETPERGPAGEKERETRVETKTTTTKEAANTQRQWREEIEKQRARERKDERDNER